MVTQVVRYVRARRVLWRLAADEVVMRRVGEPAERAEAQMKGVAAAVWLVLDEPRSLLELEAELGAIGCADPAAEAREALSLLLEHRLVEEADRRHPDG